VHSIAGAVMGLHAAHDVQYVACSSLLIGGGGGGVVFE